MIRNPEERMDGWRNLLKGIGSRGDATEDTHWGTYKFMSDQELSSLYIGEGLGRKIVNSFPEDMTRMWITINDDADEYVKKQLQYLKAQSVFNKALSMSRLYRGCLILMLVDDGVKDLEKPLGKNIRGVTGLKVYPASRIETDVSDLNEDPSSPYFEDIEVYRIRKLRGGYLRVHTSRCLKIMGEWIPDVEGTALSFTYRYWGISALQPVYERLSNFGAMEQGVTQLTLEFAVAVYKLKNLLELLANNNEKAIYQRMDIMAASKSLINAVFLADGEEFGRNSVSVAGLSDLIDRFMMFLSAVAEIPVTRLFGRSPAGMNATGDSDLENYYSKVHVKQETQLRPCLQTLIDLIAQPQGGSENEVTFTFNPLKEPTQKEIVDNRQTQAKTDEIYMKYGVYAPQEVRQSRFESGYNIETEIEGEGAENSIQVVKQTVDALDDIQLALDEGKLSPKAAFNLLRKMGLAGTTDSFKSEMEGRKEYQRERVGIPEKDSGTLDRLK